jgi:ferredoxin
MIYIRYRIDNDCLACVAICSVGALFTKEGISIDKLKDSDTLIAKDA